MQLHQFAYSHFNEKARWALAFKGLEAVRRTYLPGPHQAPLKKLSGQPQTPVLQVGEVIVPGSAAIIDWLEQHYPEPALYPADPEQRRAALALQAELDRDFGPAVRRLVFEVLVDDLGYLCRMFAAEASTLKRVGYRAMLPLVRPLMIKGNGLTEALLTSSRRCVQETLDELAERVKPGGYLVGDQFTVADLTAAALTAPLLKLEHPDMAKPQPAPAAYEALVGGFADHPFARWAQSVYHRHRSAN